MPLPVPQLDDRRFQDIVDEAKSLIPRFCPEWTDHNVSDPGIALIELFAWMTDMLLYRVNQVPDKLYVAFLELIGVRLEPPRAARAPVTFYLSAPQPEAVTIPEGTEVATVRTETSPAIIFSTEADLSIRPPALKAALTRGAAAGNDGWLIHDLRQMSLPNQKLSMFPPSPSAGDAFYLGFEADHSQHVLALVVDCELAGGAGVNPDSPPTEWQVWQGGVQPWVACEVEYDGTGGFNRSGEIILHTPAMAPGTFQGIAGYWLRCRLTAEQAGANGYRVSPDLESLRVEARGGTAPARHATVVEDELLGKSDGSPGQAFRLLHTPVLARDHAREHLVVTAPGTEAEPWVEVDDFAASGPEDPHFTLDSLDGTLTLGPALLQPDGTLYRFGRVPPRLATLHFRRYRHGGGVLGNVGRGTLSVPKTSIPYVARVTNRAPASGGRDAQSLDDARLRAPQALRTRTRAVTSDDYEYLAREVPGVARARCLGPGAQPGAPSAPRPGQVFMIVLPQVDAPDGYISPDNLAMSAELRMAVTGYLDERRLLGTSFDVQAPYYVWVAVRASVRVAERADQAQRDAVRQRVEAALYRFLNPVVGGAGGAGWPFGRDLHVAEIYGLLQRVPGVEFTEDVRVTVSDPSNPGVPQVAPPRLTVPPHGLICSDRHEVIVQ